jgi:hypothetical protein
MPDISACPLCGGVCFLIHPLETDINYHVGCSSCTYCSVKGPSEEKALEAHELITKVLNNASVKIGKKQK